MPSVGHFVSDAAGVRLRNGAACIGRLTAYGGRAIFTIGESMTEGAGLRISLPNCRLARETTDMTRELFPSVACAVLGLVGCAEIKSDAKLDEAADLVEQHTGRRPAWTVPWDDQPPAWTGQATLRLNDALVMALRNNRDLRADLEMIGQANADLVQAGLLQNPSFDFMLMLPSGGGRTMLRSEALPMMPLQDLWLIPARQQVAKAELQKAVLRVADRAVALAAEVKPEVACEEAVEPDGEDLVGHGLVAPGPHGQVARLRPTEAPAGAVDRELGPVLEVFAVEV